MISSSCAPPGGGHPTGLHRLGTASSRQELAAALLCAAVRAGLFGGGDGDGDGEGERSALARRLASAVPLPPSMRSSHAQVHGGNDSGDDDDGGGPESSSSSSSSSSARRRRRRRCALLLEGTALGDALLGQAEDLAEEGALVVEAARARLLLSLSEEAKKEEEEEAGATANGPPPPPPPPPLLLPEPGSRAAERAGAWALGVVDSAVLPGPAGSGGLLVLAPLASAVPRCFRGAAVDFEWVRSSNKSSKSSKSRDAVDVDGGGSGGDSDGEDLSSSPLSSLSLVVRAAADLPRGVELRRGCALVGQSALDVAVAGGLEALPALLLPRSPSGCAAAGADEDLRQEEEEEKKRPLSRSIPDGYGGQAVWHCFERELPSVGIAHKEASRRRKEKEKEAPATKPASAALHLARRAADACGLLPSSSAAGALDLLAALGRPTPKRALAAFALHLIASPNDDDDDNDEEEAHQHEREAAAAATAALKQAGVKRLLRGSLRLGWRPRRSRSLPPSCFFERPRTR